LTTILVILFVSPFFVQEIDASVTLSRQVSRLSYGVLFSPVRKVKFVSDIWPHIFDLHLPDLTSGNLDSRIPHCGNSSTNTEQQMAQTICEHNRALFLELHAERLDMLDEISAALQHIYHLLPSDRTLSRHFGSKRSLLPIGGYILNGLFNTASEADLNPIKHHMRSIARGMPHLDRGLQLQGNRLASFNEMSAIRMDSFRNLTILQERAINDSNDELAIIFNSEIQDQQRIIMAVKRLQDYIKHIRHIDQFRQGVELLLHGILSPQLVAKSTLGSNLMAIKSHLERYFPNFALVFDRACPFYTLHDYFFGRHSMHFLIQIQIPLTTFQHDFTVYEMIKFPVSVTGRPTYNTFPPIYRVILLPADTVTFILLWKTMTPNAILSYSISQTAVYL